MQLVHVHITKESTRLAILSPLTRCEVLTHLAWYIGACAALVCIQSSSSLAKITLSLYALCGSFIYFWLHGVSSANPTTSVLHRSAHRCRTDLPPPRLYDLTKANERSSSAAIRPGTWAWAKVHQMH